DALRIAGRARRVDDRRDLVGLYGERALPVLCRAALILRGVATGANLVEREILAGTLRVAEPDHVTQRPALRAHLRDLGRLFGRRCEDRDRARIVQQIRDLLGRERWIDRNVRQT